MSFIKLVFFKSADAPSLVDAIEDAFETIDIDVYEKLVAFFAYGMNANSGRKDGVKAILQCTNPWLTFGWCLSHQLELALKDGLGKNQLFQNVEEMILRLYYIYKKPPKKLRQLKNLYDMFKENGEFTRNGYRPKKASGFSFIHLFLLFNLDAKNRNE